MPVIDSYPRAAQFGIAVLAQPRYVPNKGAAQWLNVAVQNTADNMGNPIQVSTGEVITPDCNSYAMGRQWIVLRILPNIHLRPELG